MTAVVDCWVLAWKTPVESALSELKELKLISGFNLYEVQEGIEAVRVTEPIVQLCQPSDHHQFRQTSLRPIGKAV